MDTDLLNNTFSVLSLLFERGEVFKAFNMKITVF